MKESEYISSILERIPELNVEYAIGAMGGSEALYEKTLTHMVRQIPLNIGEMDASIKSNGDFGVFAVKVHGIKSAFRQVGIMALASKAESLEMAAKAGDRTYCEENYGTFREELLWFYDQVNEATGQISGSETDAGLEGANVGNISDFIDELKQAAEAADLCDSMSAYNILLPLTKTRFGGNTDDLVLKAATALDQFKPFEALEYIAELLNECKKTQL